MDKTNGKAQRPIRVGKVSRAGVHSKWDVSEGRSRSNGRKAARDLLLAKGTVQKEGV